MASKPSAKVITAVAFGAPRSPPHISLAILRRCRNVGSLCHRIQGEFQCQLQTQSTHLPTFDRGKMGYAGIVVRVLD